MRSLKQLAWGFPTLFRRAAAGRRPKRPARLVGEWCELERRDVPATITWDTTAAPNGGDWSTPANWKGGVVPTAADDAVINLTVANKTVAYNSAGTYTVGSITTNPNTTFNVNKGVFTIAASPSTGTFSGPVHVFAGVTLAAGTNAKVQVNAGVTVTVDGTLAVNSPALFVGQRGVYSTGPLVTVTNGGLLSLTNSTLTATGTAPGGPGSGAQIAIGSGASFKSTNTTVGWDSVTLDTNATVAVGDITTTAFDATVTTPVKL